VKPARPRRLRPPLRRRLAPPPPLERRGFALAAPIEILDAVSGPFERAIPAGRPPHPGRAGRPRRG
jgi:hypothetical protein